MKTTAQIPDSLVEQTRRIANRERTTLKALVEQGLGRAVAEHQRASAFRLRNVTFKGAGLQPGLAGVSWEQIRELTYESRGG